MTKYYAEPSRKWTKPHARRSNHLLVKTWAPSGPPHIWTAWLIAWLCGQIRSWNWLHLGQTSKWVLTMTLINNENLLLQLATHQTALIREMRMSICTKKYAQKQVAKKRGGNGEGNREIACWPWAGGQAFRGKTRLWVYLRVSADDTYKSTSHEVQGRGPLMEGRGRAFLLFLTPYIHEKWGEGKGLQS